jgi:hypothetical protein
MLQKAILSGVAAPDPAAAPADDRLKLRLQIILPRFGDLEHGATGRGFIT